MKIKNNKLKLLIIVLVFFMQLFFGKVKDTFAIYKSSLPASISLSVIDPSANYEISFNLNGGTGTANSLHKTYGSTLGTLPGSDAVSKANSNFVGWYTAASGGTRVNANTIVTGNITYYAHYVEIICKEAQTLHSSGNVDFGTIPNSTTMSGGFAYDCNVNGDYDTNDNPIYDASTERFYFLTMDNNKIASLIYSNNTHTDSSTSITSPMCNATPVLYNSNRMNYQAPTTAYLELPSSTQWNKVELHNLPRQIVAHDGTTISFLRNTIETFSYPGKSSRFATTQEIVAACNLTNPIATDNELNACLYLLENTDLYGNCQSNYWLETPHEGIQNNDIYRIGTYRNRIFSTWLNPNDQSYGFSGVRPVIEVPYEAIGYYGGNFVNKFKVNYHLDVGSVDSTVLVNENSTIGSFPTNPTRLGYTFGGWYADTSYTTQVTTSKVVVEDLDLYAKWNPTPTYTVTFELYGGQMTGDNPITVNTGTVITDWPTPTLHDYVFDDWYSDDQYNTLLDRTAPITANIIVYAKWTALDPVARVNGVIYTSMEDAIDAVPTGVTTSTEVTLLKNLTITTIEEAILISNNKYVDFNLNQFTISGSFTSDDAKRHLITVDGGTTSIPAAKLIVRNGTINSTGAKSAIFVKHGDAGNKKGILYIQNGAVINATGSISAVMADGIIEMTGGSITSNVTGHAAINLNPSAEMTMSGGSIETSGTTKSQAIYNDRGTVTISGSAYLYSQPTSTLRATLHNLGGTMTILGGTIVSKNYAAVINARYTANGENINGVLTVGTNDGVVDTSSPVMRGKTYGLYNDNGTVNFYDGILESLNNTTAYFGNITNKPCGFINGSVNVSGTTYHSTYLNMTSYTVNFYPQNGDTVPSITVINGNMIDSQMPSDPTKANYYFDGWYDNNTLIDSTTIVTQDINAYARWVQSISNATIDSTMNIYKGFTQNISIAESDIEPRTYVSSNPAVATVDSDGVVTALSDGTTTITMTGVYSGATRTVTVNVETLMHTVEFLQDDGETVFTSVSVEHNTALGALMPNPRTVQNHIFNSWYIDGNTLLPFTSQTVVQGDTTVIESWKESIAIANVSSSLNVRINNTKQIVIEATDGGLVEDVSYVSSDSTIATVDATGLISGLTIGDITITVTGADSSATRTINVHVVDTFSVIFDNDGVVYDTMTILPDEPLGSLPTAPTKSGYVFVGWYVESAEPYNTRIDVDTIIDSNKRYYARWTADTNHAEMNGTIYTTVQAAVNAAPTTGKTTIRLLQNVTYTTMIDTYNEDTNNNTIKNIVYDLNGFSVTNNDTYVFRTKGPIEIKNGSIYTSSDKGAIEANDADASIKLYDVDITASGNRQAIYNAGGVIEIYGNSHISAKAVTSSSAKRATVQNQLGTLRIFGGTITNTTTGSAEGIALTIESGVFELHNCTIEATRSTGGIGMYIKNGTNTIGQSDGVHDTSNIIIKGYANGIQTIKNFWFYDGIVMAVSPNAAINDETKIYRYEKGLNKVNSTEIIGGVTYNTLYYSS